MIRAFFAAVTVVAASIAAAPTVGADAVSELMGMLPHGFGPDNCHPVDFDEKSGMTAKVSCGPSTSGGPSGANFAHFVSMRAMVATANRMLEIMGPVPCPGRNSANPSNGPAGFVACGMEPDGPRMMISVNDDLQLGVVFGSSLEALWDWAGFAR